MFMEGYRTILEQLLGGLSQPGVRGPQPNQQQGFGGQGIPAQGQRSAPRSTGHFHYSVTTVGHDGRVHRYTNNSRPESPISGGRQIPVPTVTDFLGMQNVGVEPDGGQQHFHTTQGPFAEGSLQTMLRSLMETLGPMHGMLGNPGDYIPHVSLFGGVNIRA
jgi:hypothetical protein